MTTIDELYDPRFKNDKAFQEVSKKHVKLNKKNVKENNRILKDIVITKIVQCMREIDNDFDDLFENVLYSGSFYKNLKVSEPDEYDLCLMINLCRSIDPDLIEIEPDEYVPTYVNIRVLDREFTGNNKFWLDMLTEDDYLDQDKFRGWMHSVLNRALNKLSKDILTNGFMIKYHRTSYQISFRQSGPAFTLNLLRKRDGREINFDLVPCLVFRNHNLTGFRPYTGEKWIAIAKPVKNDDVQDKELLWRAGFYDDEKRLLAGQIKPIIRMVKKLRDVHEWDYLKSYFIETLFLHELEEPDFRYYYPGASRTCIFIYMLIKQLQYKLENGEIPNYWNEDFNLLDQINLPQLTKMANELENFINNIDDNIDNDKSILLQIFESKMKIK